MKAKAKFLTCALALTGLASGLSQQLPAAIQFSSPAYNVAEDAGTALITVLRTGDTDSVVTVDYAASDGTAKEGTDYAAQSGALLFSAGETSKTFEVPILGDGAPESGQARVRITLSAPVSAARANTS
jgi:hypothetical protein